MMEGDAHYFEDVRLAFVAAVSLEANDDELDSEEWWNRCRGDPDVSCHHWAFNDNQWKKDHEEGERDGGTARTEQIRSEYEVVEQLFLNKVLMVDREQFELRRAVYAADYQVEFDHLDYGPLEPDIVATYYEPFDVAMVTVNFHLPSVSAADLVYLKSLKWDSTKRFSGAPGLTVHQAGELQTSDIDPQECDYAYLNAWLQKLFEETIGIEDVTLSHGDVLDCIDIRGGDEGASVFDKEPAKPLYAVITGDEGYNLNDDEVVNDYVDEGAAEMHSREYFRYFFHESSIVALFGRSFPEKKQSFEKDYTETYERYRPYTNYLGLASEVAALSDGILFLGELLLTRHVALQELDRRLSRDPLEGAKWPRVKRYTGMDLHVITDLKQSALNRLTEIEILSQSLLWGPVPDLDMMFNHKNRRESVDKTLETLESSIRDKYNRRMQNGILALTAATVILTLWTGPGPAIWSFLHDSGVDILETLWTLLP